MNLDENAIREVLVARGRRSDPAKVARELSDVTGSPQEGPFGSSIRRLLAPTKAAAAAIVLVGIVALAIQAVQPKPTSGSGPSLPVGVFQSEKAVGTGVVGSETCVAIQLTSSAYETGTVGVWWWEKGPVNCKTSVSGIMPASAHLAAVNLKGNDQSPPRIGYRVVLVLQLVPSGSETMTFTLDPAASNDAGLFPAFDDVSSVANNSFLRVDKPTVDEPGDTPIPTPQSP